MSSVARDRRGLELEGGRADHFGKVEWFFVD